MMALYKNDDGVIIFLQFFADFSALFRHYGTVLMKTFYFIINYSLLPFFNHLIWKSGSKVTDIWIWVQIWVKKCWRHQKCGHYGTFFLFSETTYGVLFLCQKWALYLNPIKIHQGWFIDKLFFIKLTLVIFLRYSYNLGKFHADILIDIILIKKRVFTFENIKACL